MEGGFGFPFGGDPEELLRGIQEFAAKQAETVQEAQREQFATLTLSTAVELTAAALKQVQPSGGIDEQAGALGRAAGCGRAERGGQARDRRRARRGDHERRRSPRDRTRVPRRPRRDR